MVSTTKPAGVIALGILTFLSAASASWALPKAAISGYQQTKIIDIANNATLATLSMPGATIIGVAVHPFHSRAYVTNNSDREITAIDMSSNTVIASVPTAQGGSPAGIVIDGTSGDMFVAKSNGKLEVRDSVSTAIDREITVNASGDELFGVDVLPNSTKVFTTSRFIVNSIGVVTLSNDGVVKLAVPDPRGIAATPDSTRVFVATKFEPRFINVATNTVHSANCPNVNNDGLNFTQYSGAAVLPNGSKAYVAAGKNQLAIIQNTATPSCSLISLGTPSLTVVNGVAVTSDGSKVMVVVGNGGGSTATRLVTIDPTTDTIASTVTLNTVPALDAIAFGKFLTLACPSFCCPNP